jgi:hypothetical protein
MMRIFLTVLFFLFIVPGSTTVFAEDTPFAVEQMIETIKRKPDFIDRWELNPETMIMPFIPMGITVEELTLMLEKNGFLVGPPTASLTKRAHSDTEIQVGASLRYHSFPWIFAHEIRLRFEFKRDALFNAYGFRFFHSL